MCGVADDSLANSFAGNAPGAAYRLPRDLSPVKTPSMPPLPTVVTLATPPQETYSTPPLFTTVRLATPADEITIRTPLPTAKPDSTWPEPIASIPPGRIVSPPAEPDHRSSNVPPLFTTVPLATVLTP
jgi:hypothetical protein